MGAFGGPKATIASMSDAASEAASTATPSPPPQAKPEPGSPFAPGPERFHPIAGGVTWVLPGLGHVLLGQPRRGAAIAFGVLGLFFGGLLVGGIDTVDSREDRLWFYVHALTGPVAFGADWLNQNRHKAWAQEVGPMRAVEVFRSAHAGEVRVNEPQNGRMPWPTLQQRPQWGDPDQFTGPRGASKSIGKVNEVALLMCALAGMMNVVALLDAVFNRRRPESQLYGKGARA